ncbi:MAG: transaldolase family protein [Chloroflexi bacterium]|nr:transaldolase family protein [Chloroflexota bacterium]
MATTLTQSSMLRTVTEFPTDYWNDSCAAAELAWGIEHGATGATSNPTIVGEVLKQELDIWAPRVRAIRGERPEATDQEVTWQVVEEMAIRGWKMLEPVFEREHGRKGRLSIQTNPTFHVSTERMLDQARHFATLAPNVQVKFPVTVAGLAAIEQATYEWISLNATVSFTVPQALAVGEAVERALQRREAEGLDVSRMSPVCTLMIGRLDDWVKTVCDRDDITVDPAAPDWAGIAVFKRTAAIYRERGYRCRLLAAAYRHHRHWSELIGGDVVLTIPYKWARRFDASDVEVRARFDVPVPAVYVTQLLDRVPDFRRAWEPDGLTPAEFDTYGATVRTLRSFIASYWSLVATVDELLLPNPDVRRKA